eukprot:TRINITY_DN8586_c0_g1_i2.p1 TRINITY_DN8586_c0_g1~~TRINITY_DN8586_c0_g1_i2.p1  ORF type:complete len:653 (-),score=106.21 TRINITY_DN8586_c0_g1_i2:756-2714(-)
MASIGMNTRSKNKLSYSGTIFPRLSLEEGIQFSEDCKRRFVDHGLFVPAKHTSVVWKYMSLLDPVSARCGLCNQDFKFQGATSTLKRHLQDQHGVVFAAKPADSEQPRITDYRIGGAKRQREFNETVAKMVVDWVIDSGRAPHILEDKGLRAAFTVASHGAITLPCAKTVRRIIDEKGNEEVQRIIAELKAAYFICQTSDGWTSQNLDSYGGSTVHYVGNDGKLNKVSISLATVLDSHTAEEIYREWQQVWQRLEIPAAKIVCIVTDNGANYVRAARIAPAHIEHLPCAAHTLQLSIHDAIEDSKPLKNLFTKCNRLIDMAKKSMLLTRSLSKHCKALGIKQTKLKVAVATRWNSQLHAIDTLLSMQGALGALQVEQQKLTLGKSMDGVSDSFLQCYPDGGEWVLMKQAAHVLRAVAEVTTRVEGDTYVTLSLATVLIGELRGRLAKPFSTNEVAVVARLRTCLRKSLEARMPATDLQLKTVLLDPRMRGALLEPFKEQLTRVWTSLQIDAEELSAKRASEKPLQLNGGGDSDEDSMDVSLFDRLINKQERKGLTAAEEVRRYQSEGVIGIEDCPIKWWHDNSASYPLLSHIAKKYLCIVATSAPSERMFSTAGRLSKDLRTNVNPARLEALVLMKQNSAKRVKSGLAPLSL